VFADPTCVFVTRTVNIIIAFKPINKGCFYMEIGISLIDLKLEKYHFGAIPKLGETKPLPDSGDILG